MNAAVRLLPLFASVLPLFLGTGCPSDDSSPPNALLGDAAAGPGDAAADGPGDGGSSKPVSRVSLSHISLILAYDAIQAVDATVLAADGTVLTGHTILWSTDDVEKVTVDGGKVSQGARVELQAVGRNGATVSVTVAGEPNVRSTVVVSVPHAPIAEIKVDADPPVTTFNVGQKYQFTAKALDPRGHDITAGKLFFWKSSDTSVASVNDDGLVSIWRPGMVIITATCEDVSGMRSLETGDGSGPGPSNGVAIRRNLLFGTKFASGTIKFDPDYPVYDIGTKVTLTAVPDHIYTRFLSWTTTLGRNDCSSFGTMPICTLVVGEQEARVNAFFEARTWYGTFDGSYIVNKGSCSIKVLLRNGSVTYSRSPDKGRGFVAVNRFLQPLTACPAGEIGGDLSGEMTGSLANQEFDGEFSKAAWGGTERIRFHGAGIDPSMPTSGRVDINWSETGGSGTGATSFTVALEPR